MPVTEFECQIARGQIGRYLGGGPISAEAMKGLEEHLAECPGCKAVVAERRASLLGQLGGEMPTHAVAAVPVAQENPLVAALRKRGEGKAEAPKPAASKPGAGPRYTQGEAKAKPVFGKPMALAAALAVVLVGMSYVSRATRGDGALGKKAAATFAADSLPAQTTAPKAEAPAPVRPEPEPAKPTTPEPVVKATPRPVVKAAPKPVVKPTPVAAKPATTPAVPPVASKPLAKGKAAVAKIARPRRARTHKNSPASTTVRIYGLDGQPLKP